MTTGTAVPDLYPETLLDDIGTPKNTEESSARCWWAVYTRSRQEKALARDLLASRIPFYLPLVKKTSYYRGRSVSSRLPLFSNYIFVYGTEEDRAASLTTNRISRILRVPDPEALGRDLRHLRQLIASGAPLTVESRWMPGQRVRIRFGPLVGLEGTILKRQGQVRLLISVDFLQQGASVAIEESMLEPTSHDVLRRPGTVET